MAGDKNANIAVRVGADLTPLQRDMKRAASAVDRFGGRIESLKAPLMAAATAAAAVAAAVAVVAKTSAESAREIKTLSRISNVSAADFQKMAFAAKSVGIQQEKLADIFKDAQDKVGDFLVTGGGPLADYFETIAPLVGQTAEEFRNLSGAQVLGKFQAGLDAANISMSEQTFFLEALASDAAMLQPLLTNNAEGMNKLATQADLLNASLSDQQINQLSEIAGGFDQLAQQISTTTSRAILQFDDEIKSALEGASTGIVFISKAFSQMFELFRSAENKKSIDGIDQAMAQLFKRRAEIDEQLAGSSVFVNRDNLRKEKEELFLAYDELAARRQILQEEAENGGNMPEEFALDRIAPASPIIATEELQNQIEANKELVALSNEEFLTLNDEMNNKLAQQEIMAFDLRRRAMKRALNDMSFLMQGNSRKMFEIGKAAAIANAVVAGGESAIEAWRSGMETPGPFAPAVAAAYTAASLARTGIMIQKISSTSFGSKGGGGGGGGGGGFSNAIPQGVADGASGASAENTTVNINLEGEVFGRDQVRGLIGQINDALDDGYSLRI